MKNTLNSTSWQTIALTLWIASTASSALAAPAQPVPAQPAASGQQQAPSQQPQSADSATPAAPAEKRDGWSFSDISRIPVQHAGRLKPLDTVAREAVLFITGSRSFEGWSSMELLLSWISAPQSWDQHAFIRIGNQDVLRQLGLEENRKLFSPRELLDQSYLAQYAQTIEKNRSGGQPATVTATEKPSPRDQELQRVLERLSLYRAIVTGEAWQVLPRRAPQAWESLAGPPPGAPAVAASSASEQQADEQIRADFARAVIAYRSGDRGTFETASTEARSLIQSRIEGWGQSLERMISIEDVYNRFQPFHLAWILYFVASMLLILSMYLHQAAPKWSLRLRWSGVTVSTLGFLGHAVGMGLRSYVAGRPPVSNMYESVIWVSFGVLVFAYVLYLMQRQVVLLAVACVCAMVALVAADAAPSIMDPGIHPLVPVLRSNYWLTIHVLTITLSYAAFMLSLGLADVSLWQFIRGGTGMSARVNNLNQLAYRAQQFGVVLVAAGTILGGIWADYSWGRFWGWDPKEVWALIVLLAYTAILHARFTNWLNSFSYAAWTVGAFLTVLMAWYGVNFVLGVGLHSYGFSTGGQGSVAIFCLAQLGYIAVAWTRYRGVKSRLSATAQAPTSAG